MQLGSGISFKVIDDDGTPHMAGYEQDAIWSWAGSEAWNSGRSDHTSTSQESQCILKKEIRQLKQAKVR